MYRMHWTKDDEMGLSTRRQAQDWVGLMWVMRLWTLIKDV